MALHVKTKIEGRKRETKRWEENIGGVSFERSVTSPKGSLENFRKPPYHVAQRQRDN